MKYQENLFSWLKRLCQEIKYPSENFCFPQKMCFFSIMFEKKTIRHLEKSSPLIFPAPGVIFTANRSVYSYFKRLNFWLNNLYNFEKPKRKIAVAAVKESGDYVVNLDCDNRDRFFSLYLVFCYQNCCDLL